MVILLGPCQKFPCDVLVRSVNRMRNWRKFAAKMRLETANPLIIPRSLTHTHTHIHYIYIYVRCFGLRFWRPVADSAPAFRKAWPCWERRSCDQRSTTQSSCHRNIRSFTSLLSLKTKRCWRDGRSHVHAYGGEQKSSKSRLGH